MVFGFKRKSKDASASAATATASSSTSGAAANAGERNATMTRSTSWRDRSKKNTSSTGSTGTGNSGAPASSLKAAAAPSSTRSLHSQGGGIEADNSERTEATNVTNNKTRDKLNNNNASKAAMLSKSERIPSSRTTMPSTATTSANATTPKPPLAPRASSPPLKSAMKSSSRFSSNNAMNNSSDRGMSKSAPSTRSREHYTGPIDVDEIPASYAMDDASIVSPSVLGKIMYHGDDNHEEEEEEEQQRRANTDDRPPVIAISARQRKPSSTIKSAVKKTESSTHQKVVQQQQHQSASAVSSGPATIITPTNSSPSHTPPRSGTSKTNKKTHPNSKIRVVGSPTSLGSGGSVSSVGVGTTDDVSVVSMDGGQSISNLSVMSRVSIHMDHFLAEMAMADNAQLEQLAIQEMKHKQIIPQKIKKLNAKISVLHEERDVLVGLIDQLSELVNNQENKKAKRKAKREKKRLKKERKEKKRLEKEQLDQQQQQQQQQQQPDHSMETKPTPLTQDESESSSHGQDSVAAKTSTPTTKNSAAANFMTTAATAMTTAATAMTTKHWWAPDPDDATDLLNTSTDTPNNHNHNMNNNNNKLNDSISTNSFDPLGSRTGDDTFAQLWDDELMGGGGASLHDGSAASLTGGGGASLTDLPTRHHHMAAGVSTTEGGDKSESDDDDNQSDDDSNHHPQGISSKETRQQQRQQQKAEAFLLVESLPDRGEDDDDDDNSQPRAAVSDSDHESEDEDKRFVLPATLTSPSGNNHNHNNNMAPLSARSFASHRSADTNDDDDTTEQSSQRLSNVKGRFFGLVETETYLPGNMPRSRGNSPTGRKTKKSEGGGSDSESDSDSDDDTTTSSRSSLGHREMVDLAADEEGEKPSVSHHLAKQLMARLKQQEDKQQEQEELQAKLQEQLLRRTNSNRSLNSAGNSVDGNSHPLFANAVFMPDRRKSLMTSASMGDLVGARERTAALDLASAAGLNTRDQAYVSVIDDVVELRQALHTSKLELEDLRKERAFQEARVRELLAALEERFEDSVEGDDAESDDEDDNADDNTGDDDRPKSNGNAESADEVGAGKKRKRIQGFLTQKVNECAELTATVEQLRDQVAEQQAKIDELAAQQSSTDIAAQLKSMGSHDEAEEKIIAVKRDSVLFALGKDQIEKQLLEKSGECIDLREQIEKLKEVIAEKETEYQEVHRELFTANLALGVEVDRKCEAQEALDDMKHEFEIAKKENADMKIRVEEFDERQEVVVNELHNKCMMIEEMEHEHEQERERMSAKLIQKEAEIGDLSGELEVLKRKVEIMEHDYEEMKEKGDANNTVVAELQKLLDVETDKKDMLAEQIQGMEKEKAELLAEVERLKKENEISKALIQNKEEALSDNGRSSANIQSQVEQLIRENAEISKSLTEVRESEASILKERERLVANATNMSIMLADSRAKVDFLQMQLDEYKNGSEHGMIGSQSEHGFGSGSGNMVSAVPKRGFRNFSIGGGNAAASAGSMMKDTSERSLGGQSERGERGTRFRNFLQNRMSRGGGQDGGSVGDNDDADVRDV